MHETAAMQSNRQISVVKAIVDELAGCGIKLVASLPDKDRKSVV
jgi:hypothetical protein